jgi:hypothetical protein
MSTVQEHARGGLGSTAVEMMGLLSSRGILVHEA